MNNSQTDIQRRMELEQYREALSIGLANQSLYEYVKLTNYGYKPNAFGEKLCNEVQDFLLSEKSKYAYEVLIIISPPQHGKSTNITGSAGAWYNGQRPDDNVIILSYNDVLAHRFGNMNLTKFREWNKKIFDLELEDKTATCTATDFQIRGRSGSVRSRGLTSGITGNNAKCIIIDDPIKNREEADSEGQRDKQWNAYQSDLKSRLSAQAKIIVILTRWHEDDLAGRIDAYEGSGGNIKVLRFPCECEDEATDPLHRKFGEPLCPELGKDFNWLTHMKSSYINDPTQGGKRTWDALYQGRPSALEGNIIQAVWLRFWKPVGMKLPPVRLNLPNGEIMEVAAEDLPDYWDSQCQSWDCAFKNKKTSDFVAGGIFGRRLACYYLLDAVHAQLSFTETIDAIVTLTRKYPKATSKYIEDKANGTAVIDSMRKEISGLVGIEANDDKVARANAVTPVIRSGNFYMPHPMLFPWVKEAIKEMMDFPNAKNDDFVDMITQGLNQMMYDTKDTVVSTIKEGTWAYPKLKDMGFSDFEIKSAWQHGRIKLIMIPTKWHGRRGMA